MAQALRLARPALLPDFVPDEIYREAVHAWLRGRDAQTAADILRVPRATVLKMVGSPEWGRMASTYRKELAETEAGVLTHLVHKALRVVGRALIEGDDHVLKDGTIIKKQVSAVDAARIAATLFERRAQSLRVVDGKEEKTDNSLAELFSIAEQLKKFNSAKEINVEKEPTQPIADVIDVKPLDSFESEPA